MSRRSLPLFWLCVFLAPAQAASAQARMAPPDQYSIDSASVERFGPAYRYPQSGWIVIHIEGAPYERGYQHGHLLAQEIVEYMDTLARDRSEKDPKRAWADLHARQLAFPTPLRKVP